MLNDGGNQEDIVAYLNDKNIPADETTLNLIAEKILQDTPKQGYLTISNALQWRLQYGRVVKLTEKIEGIEIHPHPTLAISSDCLGGSKKQIHLLIGD